MRSLHLGLAITLAALLATAGLTAQPPARTKPAAAANDAVAAVVNGQKILESEVARELDRQVGGRPIPAEKRTQLHSLMLKMMIDARLIDQFLASQKIEADPKAVDATIGELKQRVAAANVTFEDALKRQGLTEPALRERIGRELAFEKYAEKSLNDKALQEYFNAHKAEFDGSEVRASHILLKFPEQATDADKQAALTKIKAIREELGKGLDFAAAAKKYSDCPSKSEGGDLDFFPRRNRMVEPFAAASFTMKKGEISEPVQTEFGWHLIKVTDQKAGEKGFADVREELKMQVSRDLWEKTAEAQRKLAKIEMPK